MSRAEGTDGLLAAAGAIATATLFESNAKQGALPAAIKPLGPGQRICGPAVPVATPPGDNYWIHRAVAQAAPGEVLVVATGGSYDNGYWGEILSAAALARGLAGVVLDGPARDGTAVVATGVPVFARGLNIIGPSKDPRCAGAVGLRIRIGGVQIDPGDLVVGDDDGVVVIARDRCPGGRRRGAGARPLRGGGHDPPPRRRDHPPDLRDGVARAVHDAPEGPPPKDSVVRVVHGPGVGDARPRSRSSGCGAWSLSGRRLWTIIGGMCTRSPWRISRSSSPIVMSPRPEVT